MATKLIVFPLALISNLPVFVMQFPIPMHLVVFPLTYIVPAIAELKSTFACFHTIFLITLVSAPSFKDKHNKLGIIIVVRLTGYLLV